MESERQATKREGRLHGKPAAARGSTPWLMKVGLDRVGADDIEGGAWEAISVRPRIERETTGRPRSGLQGD